MGKEKTMEVKINMLSWFGILLREAHVFMFVLTRYHRSLFGGQKQFLTSVLSESHRGSMREKTNATNIKRVAPLTCQPLFVLRWRLEPI